MMLRGILPRPSFPPSSFSVRFMRIFQSMFAQSNFFHVFDLPVHYDVTVERLAPKYRELLKKVHPDKFHQKSTLEKERSEDESRLINEAYRTLQNPLRRGLHILELKNSPLVENQLDVTSDVLLEIYETNEELAEIQDRKRLAEIKSKNDKEVVALIGKVSEAFQGNRIEDAKILLSQMKYYTTIEERIRVIELELGIVR